MKDQIWTENPLEFSKIKYDNRHFILHPKIIELVNSFNANKILDHGCGDGLMNLLLNKSTEVGIYDINMQILEIAKNNLKGLKLNVYRNSQVIPSDYYDCAISSNVLMTVDNEIEYLKILKDLKRSVKKKGGRIIIGITHPCFRQYDYSTYKTQYSKEKVFNYFKEGDPFLVYLKASENNEYIQFTDFHYSLSYTLEKIFQVGLKIENFLELPDKTINDKYYNLLYSPFLIIVCKP